MFRFCSGSSALFVSHGTGGKPRVTPGEVASLCLWPHDKQIAPTRWISVSSEISFSRTAVEPETTGPAHLSHEYAER
jgi:hypothetical protein